jgi:probable selenium-dependent hydroxylase accessory protein YqeC
MAMQLAEALDLRRGEMAALIGAGGKTTTMFRLAKELREEGRKVLVTTTTKIFKPSKPHVDRLFLVEDIDSLTTACAKIAPPAIVGVGAGVSAEGKLLGLPSAWLDRLNDEKIFDAILVEADGAASRLFKVPGDGEPVIPATSQLTLWLMAIGVLNQPLAAASVHRAERAIALLDCQPSQLVTADLIVQLVKHPAGCWKGTPAASRRVAVINQADSPQQVDEARSLAEKLLGCGIDRTVITSYAGKEPVKEILLR